MNISLFLIGMLFLAFFIVPVIYIHRVQKNKGKKLLKHFAELALENGIKINDSDIWNENNCIGIDETNGKIFLLNKTDENEETTQINLNDVNQCKLSPTYRKVKGDKSSGITERIDIIFILNEGNAEKVINIYNINSGATISEEPALAEKWFNRANEYIKKRK